DRPKDPSPRLLLCVGLAAVQPAAPAASPPRDRPLDSGAAGGSGPDPRGGDPDPGSERRRAASVRDDPLSAHEGATPALRRFGSEVIRGAVGHKRKPP